ncbi:Protein of unknown function [Quadrisphaera granulorum]|uniref:Uncharacterized protein DUF2505 n=1 Tax=Quadrisphaera granulorum TaxID=317664 RepID=A0A316AC28_9ACTN|nr:DUF2505 domain-containing protein [Quadrisphaera granulorum]PWJ54828.1 uncharacterized protein DUF2505 [Quadrisphaera granulorum]SZE95774.1 Protein of unknown function [Quadrisphaera granulorum]
MRLDVLLRYPGDPHRVAQLLADPAVLDRLLDASDSLSHEVAVEGDPAGRFLVRIERVLPTDELPDIARRFVGSSMRLSQVDTWEAPAPDGSRTGTTELKVPGAPVTATARTALRPVRTGVLPGSRVHTEHSVSGTLTASVPLVGGKIERAAEEPLVRALRDQERDLAQLLS